jgi:hypothetical protein
MAAPRLQSPAAGASVQQLPAFSWTSVRGAATYQFEFAADRHFSSGVNGFGSGTTQLSTTAITNDREIADGTYYWRVRAVSKADHPGRWSSIRTLTKAWTGSPALISPTVGTTINWPSDPLDLKWTAVPYAYKYNLFVATDPALANLVLGSVSSPYQVDGPQYTLPDVLAPGTYYWAVQPVDAENDRGHRSAVASFTWAWPSGTTVSEANDFIDPSGNASSTVIEPQFTWKPVPGAASYELEISGSQDFAQGSDVGAPKTGIVGNAYTPTTILPNTEQLYWRVRARDSSGNAGAWNVGQPFTESFDQAATPTIQNLQVVDQQGNPIDPSTQTSDPTITWDPVAGASSYTVTLGNWSSTTGCDFRSPQTTTVSNPVFTLIGNHQPSTSQLPWSWSGAGGIFVLGNPGDVVPICARIVAQRDGSGGPVVSTVTQLGSASAPAFTYLEPATTPGTLTESAVANNPPYLAPANRSTWTHTPVFKWSAVPGADGYFVVISYDSNFTHLVQGGMVWTQGTTWAPPSSLLDESNDYWWEILPANSSGQVIAEPQNAADNDPQSFTKASVPPTTMAPASGATVETQPTFSWSSVYGAKDYTLQISGDQTFANPIESITTTATSYTAEDTLPADHTLYWRVRANDRNGNGLNWSNPQGQPFTHHLPVPAASAGNPTGGNSIPLFSFNPVQGAVSYNLFITQPDGSTKTGSETASFWTPQFWFGTGNWQWQVQAVFPGGAKSAYSAPVTFTHTLPAPSGVHATKSGTRIMISWSPINNAKGYQVQLSTTDGFNSPAAGDTTDNTVWVPQIDPLTAKKKLFWRVAEVDEGGNVGAYASGVFKAPRKPKPKRRIRHKRHSTGGFAPNTR